MICAFCLPGFKPTFVNVYMVSACTAITNCNNSTTTPWANSCGECSANFIWEWAANKINYDSCVAGTTANCMAYQANTKCILCKKGFNLNSDDQCEKLTAANCQADKYWNNYYGTNFDNAAKKLDSIRYWRYVNTNKFGSFGRRDLTELK